MDKIDEVLTRGVEQILPEKSGLKNLMDGKKIRVYLGIDPTGPKLHLGHTIPLRKLQAFANLGHEAILVFGTGTVLAGDPSQRKEARKTITEKEIDENIKDWKRQAEKVLDFDKINIKYNGDWLLKLGLSEIINIASNISSVQLFKRDMFQDRLAKGDTIWTHETLYPLLQGYDSVHLDVDAEIGGTDQTFNMLIGRELQKKMKGREKYVVTTPLILGTDGQTMSKSSGNCVWLDDSANDMYGKIMAISDNLINSYWQNLTDLELEDLEGKNALDAKKRLALEIVKIYHGAEKAESAQKDFEASIQKGAAPEDVREIKIEEQRVDLVDFLAENNLAASKSEAKRLIKEGAIEIDGQAIKETEIEFENNQIMRVGKKKFVKIVIS